MATGATILVVAETKDGLVRKVVLEILAEATRLAGGATVTAAVIGSLRSGESERLARHGADRILHVEGDALASYSPEAYAEAVRTAVDHAGPDVLLFGATAQGKDLGPRAAARLKTGLASDCVGFEWESGGLVAKRPVYAGKALVRASFQGGRPKIASVRPNTFTPLEPDVSRSATTETLTLGAVPSRARVVGFEASAGATVDLTEANIIVSGGRAMQGPENFNLLRRLCDILGATLGASRAAVDAGWIEHGHQVGQTGKVVNPTLYFAVGISGAIQHLAGMSTSRTIVAINKDRDAPIFKVATYGIVGDLYEIVPLLTSELERVLRE